MGMRGLTPHGPLDDKAWPPSSLLSDMGQLRAALIPWGMPEPWRRQPGERGEGLAQSPSGSVLVPLVSLLGVQDLPCGIIVTIK